MIKHIKRDHIHTINIYIFALFLMIAISYIPKIDKPLNQYGLLKLPEKNEKDASVFNFKKEAFNNLNIKAKAYVVYDILERKVIAGKNENEILPLASLTKIMTALTALSMSEKNTAINIENKSLDGRLDLGLKKNQTWRLDELLKYTLVFSSNDGAQAVADNLGGRDEFVNLMNQKADEFKFNMDFTNPAGLDVNGKIGGEGSALAVANMMNEAWKKMPSILDSTTQLRATAVSSSGILYGIPNTNQEVNNFVGIEASKTGFTEKAGGNLALVLDIAVGHPVVIVILGSTKTDRFNDAMILYKSLKESLYGEK